MNSKKLNELLNKLGISKEEWKNKNRLEYEEIISGKKHKFCECGCGKEIKLDPKYKMDYIHKRGIPRYLPGHCPRSSETRKKISEAQIGEKNHMWGKKGEQHPRTGSKQTEEAKNKIRIAQTGRIPSKEELENRSKSMKGKLAENKNPMFGMTGDKNSFWEHKHTEENIKKNREWHIGKILTEETKNKIGTASANRIITEDTRIKLRNIFFKRMEKNNGLNPLFGNGFWGKFFSYKMNKYIFFESSYELAAFYIIENNSNVLLYDRNKIYIQYEHNGFHRYYPDIFITYNNGNSEIIEVKPKYFLSDTLNEIKFKSAIEFCKSNNFKFTIWTEDELCGIKNIRKIVNECINTDRIFIFRLKKIKERMKSFPSSL